MHTIHIPRSRQPWSSLQHNQLVKTSFYEMLAPSGSLRTGTTFPSYSGRRLVACAAQRQQNALWWGIRRVINARRNQSRSSSPEPPELIDLPETTSRAMTLSSLSVDPPGTTKRKAGAGGHGVEALGADDTDYSRETIVDIARGRTGWLVAFCVGLLLAALVVEQFEDVLEQHVELSFFVPLIMGHGGNTGSQAVTTVIRALALRQITHRDMPRVVLKEAGAGCMMGAVLGLAILAFSCSWSGISTKVGATVAIALPLVSLWANGLGAFLTLLADRLKFDPAVTSVPAMTTIIDSTGLVIYFYIARWMLDIN